MQNDKLSRRVALKLLGSVPVAMGAGALVAACGKNDGPDNCNDVSALSEAEKTGRSALQYTDKSPHADKRCELCNLYITPQDRSACGGCQVVKGPIHPKGYCTAFSPKPGA